MVKSSKLNYQMQYYNDIITQTLNFKYFCGGNPIFKKIIHSSKIKIKKTS